MISYTKYLISGISSLNTGAAFSCIGMDNFSISIQGSSAGVNPATGTVNIDASIDDWTPWVTIFSNTFAGNSGIITQFNGPFGKIRASIPSITTGTFTACCRTSSNAKD